MKFFKSKMLIFFYYYFFLFETVFILLKIKILIDLKFLKFKFVNNEP